MVSNSWKIRFREVFFWLFLSIPLVEMANGYILHINNGVSIWGQLFKFGLLGVALLLLKRKEIAWFAFFAIGGVLFSLIHYLDTLSLNFLIADLQFITKILFVVPIFLVLVNIQFSKKQILQVLSSAWFVLTLNIILGILGIGFTQYALGYGYKGFFYSGNEFALVYLLLTTGLFWNILTRKQYKLAFVFSLFAFLMATMQGMKTLLIGIPLSLLVVPLLISHTRNKLLSYWQNYKQRIILGSIGLTLLFSSVLYLFLPRLYLTRISEMYERSGVIGAITGERDQYMNGAIVLFKDKFTSIEKHFGVGVTKATQALGAELGIVNKTVESDPFDLLLSFGILSIIIYALWIYKISLLLFLKKKPLTIYTNILLLILSIISGHVIYSTFVACYWALLSSLGKNKEQNSITHIGALSAGGIRGYILDTSKHQKSIGLEVSLVNTHNAKLIQTIVKFPFLILGLFKSSLDSLILKRSLIFHYHMAAKGSFIRKFILATKFWIFADKQIIHIHGGKVPIFFKKILRVNGMKYVLGFFFKLFSAVILVSESFKIELVNVLKKNNVNIDYSKWHVLPNAIEIPTKFPTPLIFTASGTLKLLFVGRFSEEKNLPTIIEIGKLIKERKINATISLVGDGKLMPWVKENIKELELGEIIIVKGWIKHEEIDSFYNSHHYFLIPSKFESFGLVALEAYKNGLPVLASKVGGLKDIVQEEKTGYSFDHDDAKGFAEKIEFLTKNPQIINKQQKFVQEYVQEFNYDDHVKKLNKIIES